MSSTRMKDSKIDSAALFPVPRPLETTHLPVPRPLPGVTSASTATLRELLQEDYNRFHCYYNHVGFTNHVAHTVIALWYLGADSDTMKAAFDQQAVYQRPAFQSPGPIGRDNWTWHLGDEQYYHAYLDFFVKELAVRGPAGTLEEYFFSDAANFPRGGHGGGEHRVEMLARFHDGLLHPLIHAGYGLELGLPGMLAEGLAQAAVHEVTPSKAMPLSFFRDTSKEPRPKTTRSVLDILARFIADSEIRPEALTDPKRMYKDAASIYGAKIAEHVKAWNPDLSTEEALRKTLEEVVFFVNLIYAVPGLVSEEEGLFNADFFTMHFVTSSMFLSTILAHLKPRSQELLLRAYVSTCLLWFIHRGKPDLNIEAFFNNTSSLKSLLDQPTTAEPHRPTLPNVPAASCTSSNPWTSILEETIVHPEGHVSKLQRTLSHFAQVYGAHVVPGHFYNKSSELRGVEKVDGTLFVRAANLTAMRLRHRGRNLDGGDARADWWDRRGYARKA